VAEPLWSPGVPPDSQPAAEPKRRHAEANVPLQLHHEGRRPAEPTGYLRRSRAVRLLEAVTSARAMSPAILANSLAVGPDELADYRAGRSRMPLDRQLRLAMLVLERVPELSRQARTLRSQVAAEVAFHAKATTTHMVSPPKLWR
jgi:hypothetical protein